MFLTDVSMFNIWRDSKCMGWWTDVDLKKKKKKKKTFTTEGITSVIPFMLYSYPQPDVSKQVNQRSWKFLRASLNGLAS